MSAVCRLLLCFFAFGIFLFPNQNYAAVLTVTNNNDTGTGSLRDAIGVATNGDQIIFAPHVVGEIVLTSSINWSKSLTINGPGAKYLSINGNGTTHHLEMSGANTNTITGLSFINGYNSGFGGSIRQDISTGILNIDGCNFLNNVANYNGGAMLIRGVVTITNSSFDGNQALVQTGGVFDSAAQLDLTCTNCTFTNNTAAREGGVLRARNPFLTINGIIRFNNCTFQNNQSNTSAGPFVQSDCVFLSDEGGGTQYMEMRNCIFDSPIANFGYNGVTSVTSFGNNLSNDNTGSTWMTDPSDLNDTPSGLGTLGDYGGHQPTVDLINTSPAINPPTSNSAPGTDERDFGRVGTADRGAFEYNGINPCTTDPFITPGGALTFCEGDSVLLSADQAGGRWFHNGIPIPEGSTANYYAKLAGNYTYHTCTFSVVTTVIVNPAPTVNASADVTICNGDNTTISVSGSAISYNWDNGLGTGASFVVSPTLTTEYIVTGSDAVPCTWDDTVIVTVNPLPTVTITGIAAMCEDASTYTLTEGTPAGGTYTGTGVTTGVFDPTVAGPGTHIITYTYTDGNGCINTDNTGIEVFPLPSVSFTPLSDLCENDAIYTLIEGSPSGGSYAGTGITGDDFNPSVALSGTHTLTYTFTDGNGCSNFASQNINVLALPPVAASFDVVICDGNTTTISATGANTYNWDNGLGAGSSHVVGPSSTTEYFVTGIGANGCAQFDSLTVTVNPLPGVTMAAISDLCESSAPYTLFEGSPAGGTYSGSGVSAGNFDPSIGPGTYWIYYDYTDGTTGCSNIDSNEILVYSVPTIIANATGTNLCDGDALTLTGSGGATYSWDMGVTDGVSFVPTIGTVNYTVTGTDPNGCMNTDQISVTVNALPNVGAGIDQTICEGTATSLSGSGAASYTWDNGITDGVTFTPIVGTITYTVTGTDINNCQNTAQVDIIVNPNPVLIVSSDITFCLGDSIYLTASGATSYDWDSGASAIDNYTLWPTNTVSIPVTGTSLACSSTENILLTLDDPNLVDAGYDPEICTGFNVTLSATGGLYYNWNGPNVTNLNTQEITFQVDTSGFYFVEITTANACIYTDSLYVTASDDPDCTIEPVTAISPNGDAVNDYWKVKGIESFPENHVIIYNRWGDIVFEADNYDNNLIRWDGTNLNGKPSGAGTYFYQIEIVNGPATTGWIQLMK